MVMMWYLLQLLLEPCVDVKVIKQIIDRTLRDIHYVREMYALGIKETEVREEIEKYQQQMIDFIQKNSDNMKFTGFDIFVLCLCYCLSVRSEISSLLLFYYPSVSQNWQ